jgi:peptidoglycan/LPS O-acetylase OafA/YrhL
MTQTGRPHPATFAAALATVALMVAGSVGPWAYSAAFSLTLNGIDRDGRVTLSLAIGAAFLLIAHRQVRGLSVGPLIGAVLVGGVCVGILAADLADIHNKHLAVRWGILVVLVGAALLIVSSAALIWQAPRRRRAPSRGTAAAPSKPDWYPDPHSEARLRYWDGAGWTEHTAR